MQRRSFLLGASGALAAAPLASLVGCARREPAAPPKPPESEPAALAALERAIFAYASCKSYRDSGSAQFISTRGKRDGRAGRAEFRTLFRRPDKFLFECREVPEVRGRDDHYLVWQSPEGARSWWGLNPKVQQFRSMLDALAGPSGVSYGAGARIPSLLFPPESGAPPHLGLVGLRAAGGAILPGGDRCELVEGLETGGSRVVLWIDQKTRLIRKVVETMQLSAEEQRAAHEAEERAGGHSHPHTHDFADFRSETVTLYKPQADAEIADADFLSGPPAKPAR